MDSTPEKTSDSNNIKSPSSPIIYSSRLQRKLAKPTPSAPEQIMKEIKQLQNANKFNYTIPNNNQSTQTHAMEPNSNDVYPVILERVSDDTPEVLHNSEIIVAEPCARNVKNSGFESKLFVSEDKIKEEEVDENGGFLTLTQILNLDKANCDVNNETTIKKGFTTGSGKTITVLETALAHAKSIFKDAITDTCLPNRKRCHSDDVEIDLRTSERDKISKLAETVISGSTIRTPLSNGSDSSKKLGGSLAAKKKLIEVSPAALEAASRLFEDINNDCQLSSYETIYNTPKRCSYTEKSNAGSFSNTPLRSKNIGNENIRQNLSKVITETQNIEKVTNCEPKIDLDDVKLEDEISMSQFYVTDTEMLLAAENADVVWDSIDVKYEDIKSEISRESDEGNLDDFASNEIQPNVIYFKENEIRNNIPVVYDRTFEKNFYGEYTMSPPVHVICSDGQVLENEENNDKTQRGNIQNKNNQNTRAASGDRQKVTKKLNVEVIENKLIKNSSNKIISAGHSLFDVIQSKELVKNNETSKQNVQKNDFGFQTASGSKVPVNKKALQAANNLFKDIYEEENSNGKEGSFVNNIGFQTSSGSKVPVNKKAFEAANNPSQDIYGEENSNGKGAPVNNIGFQTSSGSKIPVNKKALEAANNLFQDIYEEENSNGKEGASVNNIEFQTSSGSKVPVTKKALQAANSLFQDIYEEENSNGKEGAPVNNIGFQTSSGSKIPVNKKALEATNNLFQDIYEEENSNGKGAPVNNIGFQTSSGSKIPVNKKALEAATNLFQDIYQEENSNGKEKALVNNIGFQTSSGSKVPVTKKALQAANNLFQDIYEEANSNFDEGAPVNNIGFQTSSGTKVFISEEAKKTASKLFQNIEQETVPKSNKTSKLGFQTASGNTVSISDEAKKAAAKVFETIVIDSCPENIPILNSKEGRTDVRKVARTKNSFQIREMSVNETGQPDLNSTEVNIDEMSEGQNKIRSSNFENVSKKRKHCDSDISVPNKVLKPPDSLDVHDTVHIPQNVSAVKFNVKIADCDTDSNVIRHMHSQETVLDKELKKLLRLYQNKAFHLSLLKKQRELLQESLVKNNVQHIPGYLWRARQNKKVSLIEAFKELPSDIDNREIPESLLSITSENADKMKFELLSLCDMSVCQLQLDDGAVIVAVAGNTVGLQEFETALKTMPGVNAKLIPKNWTRNHYRWIVWKLASLERQFSVPFLKPRTIMMELKYRYDRDLYENHRSALRMIFEKDDTPARRMILCVSKIQNGVVELTDGWYSILAEFDPPLLEMVEKRKIVCGTKLITHGAQLLNLEEACHPLQARVNVRLKIHFNSTRRARWDAKLGYQRYPGPFPVSLKSINSRGGAVGCVRAYIARVFPIKYMEKIDARWTCFCSKAHIKREIEHQKNKEDSWDRAQHQALKELEKEWAARLNSGKNKKIPKRSEIPELRCAKTLATILERSSDPESIAAVMSPSQHGAVANYQSSLNAEKQRELEARINQLLEKEVSIQRGFVSCVLQVKIVDDPSNNEGMNLDIWGPNENVLNILKEGIIMNIFNLSVNAKSSSVHLSATKNTRYQASSTNSNESYLHLNRHYTSICDLQLQNITMRFRYVDTVGFIAKIEYNPPTRTVWLADLDYKLLRIQCYLDPTQCMVLSGYTEGELVAAMNLYSLSPILGQAQALASWETILTTRPQHPHLSKAVHETQWKVSHNKNFEEYLNKCKNIIENWKELLDKRNRQIKPFCHNPLPLATNKANL